jgi:hypothetical protein
MDDVFVVALVAGPADATAAVAAIGGGALDDNDATGKDNGEEEDDGLA